MLHATPGFGPAWHARSGDWLVVTGVAVIATTFLFWQWHGFRRRRSFFNRRSVIDGGQWFEAYWAIAPDERPLVESLLRALASDIGIHWTQLRPEDTFEDAIRLRRRYGSPDDLEELESGVVRLAKKCALDIRGLPRFEGTLGSFLDELRRLTGGLDGL